MPKPTSRAETIAALKNRFGAVAQTADEPKVQKNLRLPESAARALAELAKAEGLSQAALLVKALEEYAAQSKRRSG